MMATVRERTRERENKRERVRMSGRDTSDELHIKSVTHKCIHVELLSWVSRQPHQHDVQIPLLADPPTCVIVFYVRFQHGSGRYRFVFPVLYS